MTAEIIEARYWNDKHGIRPWELDQVPLAYYDGWPLLDQAEAKAREYAQQQAEREARANQRGGR